MPLPAITTTQQFKVSIAPVDRRGKPAPVENITWASSNDAAASVTADSSDPLSALVVAQGIGEATISVAADAKLGEGEVVITASDTVTVTQGTATVVSFVAGAVEEQP